MRCDPASNISYGGRPPTVCPGLSIVVQKCARCSAVVSGGRAQARQTIQPRAVPGEMRGARKTAAAHGTPSGFPRQSRGLVCEARLRAQQHRLAPSHGPLSTKSSVNAMGLEASAPAGEKMAALRSRSVRALNSRRCARGRDTRGPSCPPHRRNGRRTT